jgi:hypothetical protein
MEKIVSEEGVKRKREGSNQEYSEALVSSSSLDHAHASDVNKDVNLPKNMYAVRVELRLAVERREVLREMMRLEKERVKVAKKKWNNCLIRENKDPGSLFVMFHMLFTAR